MGGLEERWPPDPRLPEATLDDVSAALFILGIAGSKVQGDQDAAEEHYRRALTSDPDHAENLGNYAAFLINVRGDRSAAEQPLKRAIDVDPLHADNLARYAALLHLSRADPEQVQEYSRRAVEAAPDDPEVLANHAGFLLAAGMRDDGLRYLDRASALNPSPSVRLEVAFYRYAHDLDARRNDDGLRTAKQLLEEGIRSAGWVLDRNVEQARRSRHPEQGLLAALALVVCGRQSISSLAIFQAWQET